MQIWSVEEDKSSELVKVEIKVGSPKILNEKQDLNGYCVYKIVNNALSYITSVVGDTPLMTVNATQYEKINKEELFARKCTWKLRED